MQMEDQDVCWSSWVSTGQMRDQPEQVANDSREQNMYCSPSSFHKIPRCGGGEGGRQEEEEVVSATSAARWAALACGAALK